MKKFIAAARLRISIFAFLLLLSAAAVRAQEPLADQTAPQQRQQRPSLIRQLDLTPGQIGQIRVVNRETRDRLRAAVQRQRQARRALDAAIYADDAAESEIEQRARELAEAQAEVTKLQAKTEFRIRQTLTAEQLVRFRELRRRRAEDQMLLKQQRRNDSPPLRRPNKRFPLRNPQ